MNIEDFRYTWVLPKSAWYIKLYLWVWEASVDEVTFCKLFWGYALIWIGLPLHLLFSVLRLPGKARRRALDALRESNPVECQPKAPKQRQKIEAITLRAVKGRRVHLRFIDCAVGDWTVGTKTVGRQENAITYAFEEAGRYMIEARAYGQKHQYFITVHEKPLLLTRVLEGIADGFVSLKMFFSAREKIAIRIRTTIVVGFIVALVSEAGYGIYSLIASYGSWHPTLHELEGGARFLGGFLVGISVWIVILLLLLRTGLVATVAAAVKYLARPIGRGAKKGTLGFRDAMKIGYVAVKSNTCPRVVVEESDERT